MLMKVRDFLFTCNVWLKGQLAASHQLSWETETTMEILVEEMMSLHASSATFREIFRSQQTTQLFIEAYKAYVSKLSSAIHINHWTTRILDKLTHFALALALDNAVAGQQKREVCLACVFFDSLLDVPFLRF